MHCSVSINWLQVYPLRKSHYPHVSNALNEDNVKTNQPYHPHSLTVAVMGFAIGGVGFFLAHLARHPEVVWNRKHNPTPFETVKSNETFKIYDPLGRFDKKWSRNAL